MPAGAIKITIHDDRYFLLSRLPSQWAKGKMPALPLLWKMPYFLICLAWLASWAFRQIKKRNLTPGTLSCAVRLLSCQGVSVLPVLLGKFSTQIPTGCAREVPTSSGERWGTGPRKKVTPRRCPHMFRTWQSKLSPDAKQGVQQVPFLLLCFLDVRGLAWL